MKQQTTVGGVLTQIQEVTRRGVPQASGIISENTRFIFRSRSTRIIWLVQISIEMWQFDEQGDLYFEKFLRKFVSPVLDIWKSLGVSHSLTIVFFARSIEHIHTPIVPPVGTPSDAPQQFTSTIRHKDYFKIVIENVADIDKQIHLRNLKKEFWAFPKSVGWDIGKEGISTKKEGYTDYTPSPSSSSSSLQSESSQSYITRQPSEAGSGNFLESINTALNLLNLHYMDRDLSRTGNSIVVISAGCGFYHVTPDISLVTKQRMMDGGIGIDFISLSSPPLHHVPLFHVHCTQEGLSDFYDFPYWMNVCYVDCERDSSATVHATEYVGRSGKNKASNHNQYRSMMRSIHDNSTRYINKAFGQRLYPQPFSNNVNVPLVRLSEFVTSLSSTTTSSGDGKLSCEFCSAESEQHIKEKQAKLPHVTEWGYIDVNALEIQLRAEAECNSCQHRVVGTAGGTSQPNTNTSSTNAALINVPSSSAALPYIVNRNIMMQSHALHQDIFKHSQSAKKNSTSNHTHNHNHDHSHQNIDHTHTDHSHSNTHGTDTLSRSHGNKHTDPSVGTSMHQRAHNHSRSRSGDGGDFGPNSIPGHDDGEDMGPLRRFRSTSMVASSHGSDTESRFNEAFKFHDPHINRNSIERGPTATTESVDIFSCLDSEIFSDPNVLLQAMEQYDNNVFTSKAKLNKRFTGIATTLSLKKQHQNMEKMSTSIFHQESYNPILANNLGDYFSDDEAKQQYTTGNFNDYRSSSHLLSGNFTPSPNTPYSPIPITRKTSSAQIPSILTFPRFLSSDITNLEEYILSSIQIINALEDSMMDRYLFSYQFYDHFHTLVVNMEIAVSVQPHVDDTKNENVLIFPVEESRPIRHKLCAVYQYCDGTISASMPFIQNQVSNADIPGSDKKGGHNLIMEQMRNVILNPDYFLTQVIGIEYLFDKSPIFNTTTTGTGATAATSGIADYGSRSYHLRFPTVDPIMEVESQENSSHHNNKDNDNDTAPVHSYSHSYNHSHLHNDTQSNIHRNDNKKTDLSFDDNDLLLNREIVLDELQPSPVSRLHEHGIPIMSSSPSPSPSPARSRHSRPRGVQQRSRSRDGPDLMSKSPSSVVAVSPVSSSFYFPTNMNATGGSGPPRHSTSGPTSGSLSRSYKEKQKFDMEHFNLNQYKGALPQATSGLNTQSDGLQPIFRPITDTLGQAQMTKSTTGTNSEPPTPARLQGNQIQSQSHSQPHMESQEYRQAIEEYRERRIQVNPFKKDDSREFFKLRTHNRLRWSHVFPSGMNHINTNTLSCSFLLFA